MSHASGAFFPSPFKNSAILTLDGVGEFATTSISYGEKNKLEMLKEIHFPNSIGLLYASITDFCIACRPARKKMKLALICFQEPAIIR